MRKYIDGRYIDLTPEEEAEAERSRAEEEARERQEPPTWQDVIEAQVMYTALVTDSLLEE